MAKVDSLEAKEAKLADALPDYMKKLTNGYKRSAFWFEVFECVRKLAMVCMPVFFAEGSAEQLMFGLIVCFVTFGAYTYHLPYDESKSNFLAQICQCQIFFALLSSVALRFAATSITSAGTDLLDYVLTTLTLLPGIILTVFQSPASQIFERDFRVQAVDWIYLRFPCLQRKATLQQRRLRGSLYMNDRNSRASRTSCAVAMEAVKAQDEAQSEDNKPAALTSELNLAAIGDQRWTLGCGGSLPAAPALPAPKARRPSQRRPSHLQDDVVVSAEESRESKLSAPPSARAARLQEMRDANLSHRRMMEHDHPTHMGNADMATGNASPRMECQDSSEPDESHKTISKALYRPSICNAFALGDMDA